MLLTFALLLCCGLPSSCMVLPHTFYVEDPVLDLRLRVALLKSMPQKTLFEGLQLTRLRYTLCRLQESQKNACEKMRKEPDGAPFWPKLEKAQERSRARRLGLRALTFGSG